MQIGPSAHNVCPYRENTCAPSDPYTYTVSPDARYTGPSTILSVGPTIVPGTNNCSSDCAASCNRTSIKASCGASSGFTQKTFTTQSADAVNNNTGVDGS